MSYIRGRNIKVFITTEGAAGVKATASVPTAATDSTIGVSNTILGIGKLGQVTVNTNTVDLLKFVEGIDVTMGWEDEQSTFFGGTKEYNIPHRKKFEVSITRKAENKMFSIIADGARFGVNGVATLNGGIEELTSMSGYRLYTYDGANWDVFYHAVIPADGYKPALDPQKASTEVIKFVGNEWSSSVPVASITTSMAIE